MLMDCTVIDEYGTKQFAKDSIGFFKNGDTILLYGELGSGKTFLTKLFGKILGVSNEVTSPSFSIVNQYSGDRCINHLDFYRVESVNELFNLGLDDIFNSDCINFIEWPQVCEKQINWDHYRIFIDFVDNNPNSRRLQLIRMENK